MESYIHDSLDACIISLSSSPVGAGFFFVSKKDKTIHPVLIIASSIISPLKTNILCPLSILPLSPSRGLLFFQNWASEMLTSWYRLIDFLNPSVFIYLEEKPIFSWEGTHLAHQTIAPKTLG